METTIIFELDPLNRLTPLSWDNLLAAGRNNKPAPMPVSAAVTVAPEKITTLAELSMTFRRFSALSCEYGY